ncbi:hypothetical protein KA005_21750, partial [bacterium]|nr:hypothetical protein [bacterium]
MVGINSAIAKESAFESMDLREGIVRGSNPHDEDIKLGDFISLKEAVFNEETGEFENVVLIESGTNKSIPAKHYPMSTLKEAAPIFAGMKMYLNHPTKSEERELPERDITKWASTIIESGYREVGNKGQIIASIAPHDTWLKERLNDPIARTHLGLSVLTGGKVSYGSVSGKNMTIVEKIVRHRQGGPASVDWVTEPGAGGHVPLKESKKEGGEMELASLTMKELKEGRPDLANAIIKESKDAETNGTKDTQLKEALSENKKLKEAESKRG